MNYFFTKIKELLSYFYGLALIIGIGLLIYAGIRYTLSRGQKNLSELHLEIIFIIIGLIFVITAFTLPVIIYSFLK